MKRKEMIDQLKSFAPAITKITMTFDMGYEFSAIVSEGVICAEPGMLLDYSGGEWPPEDWKDKSKEEYDELLKNFLCDETWKVIAWDDLRDGEIKGFLDDIVYRTAIYKLIEVTFSVYNGQYKTSFVAYMKDVDNDSISACDWDHFDERVLAMAPIANKQWDYIEEILGSAVNDNFTGELPFEEIRYFKVTDGGLIEYSNEMEEFEAKIIIRNCK